MDTETEAPAPVPPAFKAKTHLKIPFGGTVIRALPFEAKHAVALAMSKHMRSNQARLDAMLALLAQLLPEDDYMAFFTTLIEREGAVEANDVFAFLRDLVEATAKLNADQGETTDGG